MSGSAAPSSSVRCRHCAKPFGAAVAFCPFCGATQIPDVPKPAAVPLKPVLAKIASVPNAPAPPANDHRPSGVSAIPTQNAAAPPPQADEPFSAPRRRRMRFSTMVWLLGLVAAAYTLRPQPTGTLIVTTAPSVPGTVLVDGNRAGAAGEPLEVSAGRHMLAYQAEGWIASQQQVTVLARHQRRLTVALLAAPATIVLDLQTPGTALRLDGAPVAIPDTGLKVPAGRHRLTATRPGFAAVGIDLVLARGERRNIAIILSPLSARELTRVAPVENWSEPVFVPPHTPFTITSTGRFRLRAGREVFLVQSGTQTNLGDARGQSLQVKAVDGQPVDVHFFLKPE